jgi:hypothetical protein
MQLHAANAIAGDAEKIDRIKPDLQRRAGLMKDGASARGNVRAAMGALEFLAVSDAMERGPNNTTGSAVMAKAKTDLHHMPRQTSSFGNCLKNSLTVSLRVGWFFSMTTVLVYVNKVVYIVRCVNLDVYTWQ